MGKHTRVKQMEIEQKELPKPEETDLKTEKIELLNGFTSTETGWSNDIVKVYLVQAEREMIEQYSEIIPYAESIFKKFSEGYTYEWDDKKQDWIRDEDGFPIKVKISKLEKEKILKMGRYVKGLMLAKINTILASRRNDPKNHMLNIFTNWENKQEDIEKMDENKSLLQKIKDRVTGEEVYEED